MSLQCPHCGQVLPAKEKIDPGFRVDVIGTAPFNERYTAIRREIELARKGLRPDGNQDRRLFLFPGVGRTGWKTNVKRRRPPSCNRALARVCY
jgi:hypothetical protein